MDRNGSPLPSGGLLDRYANDAQRNRRPTGAEQDQENSEHGVDGESEASAMAPRFALGRHRRGRQLRRNIDGWRLVQLDGHLILAVGQLKRSAGHRLGCGGNGGCRFLGGRLAAIVPLERVETFLLIVRDPAYVTDRSAKAASPERSTRSVALAH